jgi:hypothetical protein
VVVGGSVIGAVGSDVTEGTGDATIDTDCAGGFTSGEAGVAEVSDLTRKMVATIETTPPVARNAREIARRCRFGEDSDRLMT